jgi:(p)ppGpp synthase/HD superfamily hydrolase
MSDLVDDAIELAARAHRGQTRKGSRVPYLVHPLAVAEALIGWDARDELVAAGILHDTVEDTPVTLADLAARFGAEVAGLVAAVTEPDKARPWEARKEHTLAALGAASLEVVQLACADKLDNLRATRAGLEAEGEAHWGRFKRGRDAQRWYYEGVARVVRARGGDAPWARAYACAFEAVFGS